MRSSSCWPGFLNNTGHGSVEPKYTPSYHRFGKSEIVLIYVGPSEYVFANFEELPEFIEQAQLFLKKYADGEGLGFSALGFSVDWDVPNGTRYLEKLGYFDEIVVGRQWEGIVGREFAGVMAIPQVVVLLRTAESDSAAADFESISERALIRKTGFESVRDWVEEGAWVPLN